MHLYKDCGDMPILNFDIVNKTGDLKYMVVGYDGYKDLKPPKGANERWQAIRKEWLELVDDSEMAYYHNLVSECIWLETRYNMVHLILENMYKRAMSPLTFKTYADGLSEWGYKWNFKNDKLSEMQKQLKISKISKNKLTLKLDELKSYRDSKNMSSEATSLYKQAVILEKAAELSYSIDVKETPIAKWVEISKMAEKRQSQLKRSNGK